MSIRTVLCILPAKAFDEDLRVAGDFCREADAHLIAVPTQLISYPIVSNDRALSSVWLEDRQREMDELAQTVDELKRKLGSTDLSFDVSGMCVEYGLARRRISQRALYADLVLVGRQACLVEGIRTDVVNGVLFETATPVIVNGRNEPLSIAPQSIVLAWDSSNEAACAARQSLEFMKLARTVFVTMIDPVVKDDVNGEEPGADIATFLARHGVPVQVDRLPSGGRPVDQALLQHTVDVGATLLVMGAYNHPRWQQIMFGGVTNNLIDQGAVPLFLSR